MMSKEKMVSMALMLLGVIFFGVYLWWAVNYNAANGGWGAGIWAVAVGTFLTGAIAFFGHDDK